MRRYLVLMTATALTACGAGGALTAGGTAVGTGGAGTGTGAGGTTTPTKYTEFASPTTDHSYTGVGGTHTYSYQKDQAGVSQYSQLYQGNAEKLTDNAVTISYSARDGIFTLAVADTKSGATSTTRFQDPAHRIDLDNRIPDLSASNVRYLEVGSGTGVPYEPGSNFTTTTLFYEVPGTTTKYVSFAGYLRNVVSTATTTVGTNTFVQDTNLIDRGAFAYGVLTDAANIPTSGSGTYSGSMLASMVNSPATNPSYFQWIYGTSSTTVDFGTNKINVALAGTVMTTETDHMTSGSAFIPDGSKFAANASGALSTIGLKGFSGTFSDATFTSASGTVLEHLTPPTSTSEIVASRVLPEIVIAASSFDGNFYGPKGEELGGGFRIIGGGPTQRIDILGAFTGKGN
ncbi:MAG: transferrin-binding protein-like solute binding protein [Sphingomonadaceae bacterium]|nr:transferrin-binding protein-like solute binding protein [Sphingomonadaceae bacterium]